MLAKRTQHNMMDYGPIFMLSAYGFAIVIASFLFLYIGYWLDNKLNTQPMFMIGLFFLAVFICIGRLYQEAWLRKKGF